ncbi:MAG: autotransporter assembly complex protein TamA [Pseudomonadales bacterium]|nr:autotransporter assembly complex protein TamA [Pseudomonadales bacterium]
MPLTRALALALSIGLFSPLLCAQLTIDINVNGVDKTLENNIRLLLSLEQQKEHPLMSEGRLRRLHKNAPSEITRALQPFGYYRPVVKTELVQTSDKHWQASYRVDPGPPILIGKFDFAISKEMGQDSAFQRLIDKFPLHEGNSFNHLEYESIKTNLSQLAAERGYVDARFTEHRVVIDLETYEAHVTLHYEGGRRYHFGTVQLEQDLLEPQLLQRFIPFEQGSPYRYDALIDLQQALNDSNYFQTVEVSPGQPQTENAEIPVTVALTPRKPHRYSLGLGYGTDTGARTSFNWEMPRVNDRGHRFNSEAKISEIGYSLSASYRVPVLNPRTDQIIYNIGQVNEKTDVSDSTVRTIGTNLNRNRGPWRESLFINYQVEEFVVGSDRGESTLLMPGFNWTRSWGNNIITSFDGIRFDIGLRGAHEDVVSDLSFLQLQGGIKVINRLGQRNRLITRGRIATTWTEDFQQLPSSVRFFAGGAQSVRGFSYQSLGPRDANGDVIGGNHLMVGSIELEHSLNNKWGAALFYDAGNAMDSFADKLERGAGLGIRWRSPVGPVRLDLATAVSRDDHPWRLHISIGPDL